MDRSGLSERLTAIFHGTTPPPSPTFTDDATRSLAEALEQAHRHHEELTSAGQDASPALEEILAIKRRMREGGKLQPGDDLADGRFKLLELIGRGGFAHVFKAYDRQTRHLVAIKVLHGQYAHDRSRRDRFFRGARKMADLQHQSIVRVIEPRREEEGYHYFVMELAEGGDLRQAVLEERLDLTQKLDILQAVGQALEHAHDRGIIHRDVKPANILLDAKDQPKLTDFDLVRAQDSTGGTRTGMLGTIIYAAPEALERAKDADVTADVFGLGMTGIFTVYGRDLPARQLLRDAPGFARRLDAPEPIREALAQAVAWDREERQDSVAELCAGLKRQEAPSRTQRNRSTRSATKHLRAEEIDERLDQAAHWIERAKVIQQILETTADPKASLRKLESLQVRASDTHDLFFLDQLAQDIAQRWPDSAPAAEELSRVLYADRRPPPEELFTQVETRRDGSVELWRAIDAGRFQMGSSDAEPDYDQEKHPLGAYSNERPQHEVRISQPFRLMVVPVTNAMYQAFDSSHRAEEWTDVGDRELDHHPVVNVDRYQATAFCRWLSHHGYSGARLPSEAEWEYACRAGTSSRFWSGDTEEALEPVAWYQANAGSRTHRVGQKPTNPWGLYDLHGNVWEWCADGWDSRAYIQRAQEQPAIDPSTNAEIWDTKAPRVLRGGSWASPARYLRAAYRSRYWRGYWSGHVGFRVCVSGPEHA